MDFTIFSWIISAIIFLYLGLSQFIIRFILHRKIVKKHSLYIIGFVILCISMIFYLLYSEEWWYNTNYIMISYILPYTMKYKFLLTEVWYTVVFFRNLWLPIFIALNVIAIETAMYPMSSRYRMLHKFSHNKLLIMVGMLFAYFIVRFFDPNHLLANYFLSIAVYTAVFYLRFGFVTILYILQKYAISNTIGTIITISIILLSREYFLLPLVMYVGFGISDIWMDFFHRNASSLVFCAYFD